MKKAVILFLVFLYLSGCSAYKSLDIDELPHFVFAESDHPMSLDPRYGAFQIENRLFFALFEGLVTYDPETLEPIPGVADRWEISEDGLTYTFHLRDDALWSDGTPVTAQQFAETWLDGLRPDSDYLDFNDMLPIRGAADYYAGQGTKDDVAIRALSASEFQFELSEPTPYFLTQLLSPNFLVLPNHVIDEFGDQWTAPENFAGNGPFVIESHIEEERIILQKSTTYWDRDNVKLGKITTLFLEDAEQQLEMYQAGEIDWIVTIFSGNTGKLLNTPDFHLNPTFITYFYRINMRVSPLDDFRVRNALALSVNRRELVETVLEGSRIPAFNLTPPLHGYEGIRGMVENPERARELLAEAGYPGARGMKELILTYNNEGGHGIIAQYLSDLWKRELGISFKLKPLTWEDFINNYDTLQFEIQRGGWYGHYLDPNAFLDMFITGSSTNWPGMSNPRYDELIAQAASMQYGTERFQVLKEAEELMLHEEVPIIPLYFYMNENFIDTSVWGGWYENVMDWHPWKWIYRKEK